MERKFTKSGIPGLDEMLGGGLLDKSITTIGGPTGAGKSTFGLQFLFNGAYESNEVGVYICIEESRQDFMFHMGGYSWDILKAEREKKIVFLDYPVHEVDQILTQSSAVGEIINTVNAKRVVIDSIMPIALYFQSDDERKKGFLKLIENMRKWNTTTFIISEDTTNKEGWGLPHSIYGIERFTDGWIDLSYRYDEKSGQRMRYVEVLKMKGAAHSSRSAPASIGAEGFTISSVPGAPQPPKEKPQPKATEPNVFSMAPATIEIPVASGKKKLAKTTRTEEEDSKKPLNLSQKQLMDRIEAAKSRLSKKK